MKNNNYKPFQESPPQIGGSIGKQRLVNPSSSKGKVLFAIELIKDSFGIVFVDPLRVSGVVAAVQSKTRGNVFQRMSGVFKNGDRALLAADAKKAIIRMKARRDARLAG